MYISGQEGLLLCFRAGNLYHGQEPLYLPSSPTSCTEPSLPDQPGAHHLLLTRPSNSAWIPLLTGALQALISSQDGGKLPFAFLPQTPALALLSPQDTCHNIFNDSNCLLQLMFSAVSRIIPETREPQMEPLARNGRREG